MKKELMYILSRLINLKYSLEYDKVTIEYIQNTINELKQITDKLEGE